MEIKKGATPNKAPIMVVYGRPAVGKTKLVADMILKHGGVMLNPEDGLHEWHGDVPNFGLIESYDDLKAAIGSAVKHIDETGGKVLAIDGLDRLAALMEAWVCEKNGWRRLSDGEFGKGMSAMRNEWQNFLIKLVKLRNAKNIAIVFVGHHQPMRIQLPDSDPYMQYSLSLEEKLAKPLIADSDFMFFCTYPTKTKDLQDQGFGRKIGKARMLDPVIYTRETGEHVAKRRGDMPDSIPLQFTELEKYISFFKGKQK